MFSSNYISQILMVLYTSLPSELHSSCYDDGEGSCITNVQLVLQLARTVFRNSTCWQLPHSSNLLLSLFMLITPSDLLTSGDEDAEVLENSVLPTDVSVLARRVFIEAFKHFVACLSADEEEEMRAQYTECLRSLFDHVKNTLNSPGCTFASASYLADLISECLMLVSGAAPFDEDWDVPLDQQSVRDALELVLPSEGCWATLEATMSPEYITPIVMLADYALLPRKSQVRSAGLLRKRLSGACALKE